MKRALSTLLTTLLFAAAIVPNAMAQTQNSGFPVGLPISSGNMPEQPMSDSTKPTTTKTEVLPATPTSPTLDLGKANSERSRPSVNSSYPGYCPSLPAGTKPGDWEFREALEKCLYGT